MHPGTALEGEGLFNAHLHVRRILQRLIVEYEAALPQRGHRLDALDLLRLLALVGRSGN